MDSEYEPTTFVPSVCLFVNLCTDFEHDHRQNPTDDLSALELPFLVALPPLSLDVEDPSAQANGLPGSCGRS